MKYLVATVCIGMTQLCIAQDPPNFILILADDQGWNGTSVLMDPANPDSKSDFYETPNLERLASEGMRFSQGYAPAPKCSPSRMSIITGQTTAENHFTNTSSNVTEGKTLIEPASETRISNDEFTLPEYLASLTSFNYTSAHYGKWHISNNDPTQHGFDDSDGPNNNEAGDSGESTNDDPKLIFSLTQKGIDFMTGAMYEGRPFYLQLSHYAVHTDIESRQSSYDKYDTKTAGTLHNNTGYAAMTEDLDAGLGLILDYLDSTGMRDNTYIIYTSDNGGQLNVTSNEPLKYGKTIVFEGGIRVPLIISGPGIMANTHSDFPVVGYDFYPTIADLIGTSETLPDNLNGVSFKESLMDPQLELTEKPSLIFHSPHYDNNNNKAPRSAIINGTTKLVVEYETGGRLLYDLKADIGEATNIYDENDSTAQNMVLELRDHLLSVAAQMPAYSLTEEDIDGDGLDDSWEFEYLLGTLYDGNDDPDEDGFLNMEEHNNGTDPLTFDNCEDCNTSPLHAEPPTGLRFYPNPASHFVQMTKGNSEISEILFYTPDGKLLMKRKVGIDSKISLEGLAKGLYLLRALPGNGVALEGRLIVQ